MIVDKIEEKRDPDIKLFSKFFLFSYLQKLLVCSNCIFGGLLVGEEKIR